MKDLSVGDIFSFSSKNLAGRSTEYWNLILSVESNGLRVLQSPVRDGVPFDAYHWFLLFPSIPKASECQLVSFLPAASQMSECFALKVQAESDHLHNQSRLLDELLLMLGEVAV